MTQPPAVVIIARHGPRLDAADQNWHLSTPTPYDPPLTYGGWNQSRALGTRIASLLHAREQSLEQTASASTPDGANGAAEQNGDSSRKRKRRKHKVVIHSSPFLRCLQTSVAIAAGMAQFQPPAEQRPSSGKSRTAREMHSASPRLRGSEGVGSPNLLPIPEPRHDLAHEIAWRALSEQKRYKKFKMRVDAFLGEWLNPQYYDQITPPPPSALMVATAKAEMMENEPIDVFIPTTSSKTPSNNLWGGRQPLVRNKSRESVLDDWSDVNDAMSPPPSRRDRANSVSSIGSSIGSNDSNSGRRSPFRPLSTLSSQETAIYKPPTPSYAVSTADYIPRGYVSHAKNACVNMDYQWDSSRSPQAWGDGGEYGEEWSSMHKRFRRGVNHLAEWYSQHNADDRGEDALGFDQAEHHAEEHAEEQEDLVVVLVTHGAGCNALIGALTGQPVLLDVGMASLTMAVRKEDAPPLKIPEARTASPANGSDTPPPFADGYGSYSSLDIGLASVYEMKLVASREHLRPGADPARVTPAITSKPITKVASEDSNVPAYRPDHRGDSAHAAAGAPISAAWNLGEDKHSNTSTAIGTIRRPSLANTSSSGMLRSNTSPSSANSGFTVPATAPANSAPWTGGLWTPGASAQKIKDERRDIFSSLNDYGGRKSPGRDMVLDFTNSPPDSRPGTSTGGPSAQSLGRALDGTVEQKPEAVSVQMDYKERTPSFPKLSEEPPAGIGRSLSQKGLWGTKPAGDNPPRNWEGATKRRWTLAQD